MFLIYLCLLLILLVLHVEHADMRLQMLPRLCHARLLGLQPCTQDLHSMIARQVTSAVQTHLCTADADIHPSRDAGWDAGLLICHLSCASHTKSKLCQAENNQPACHISKRFDGGICNISQHSDIYSVVLSSAQLPSRATMRTLQRDCQFQNAG